MDGGEGRLSGRSSLLVGDGGFLLLFEGGGRRQPSSLLVVDAGGGRVFSGGGWSLPRVGSGWRCRVGSPFLGGERLLSLSLPVSHHGRLASFSAVVTGCGCPWLGGVVSGWWWSFSWVGVSLSIRWVVCGRWLCCLGGLVDVASLTCHVVGCMLVRLVR